MWFIDCSVNSYAGPSINLLWSYHCSHCCYHLRSYHRLLAIVCDHIILCDRNMACDFPIFYCLRSSQAFSLLVIVSQTCLSPAIVSLPVIVKSWVPEIVSCLDFALARSSIFTSYMSSRASRFGLALTKEAWYLWQLMEKVLSQLMACPFLVLILIRSCLSCIAVVLSLSWKPGESTRPLLWGESTRPLSQKPGE